MRERAARQVTDAQSKHDEAMQAVDQRIATYQEAVIMHGAHSEETREFSRQVAQAARNFEAAHTALKQLVPEGPQGAAGEGEMDWAGVLDQLQAGEAKCKELLTWVALISSTTEVQERLRAEQDQHD